MNEWVGTILLGVIEGVTEFLPISSTGHLLLVEHLMGLRRSELFTVGIQSGALLAVLLIYGPRLRAMITGEEGAKGKLYLWKLGAAFVLTAVLGLVASEMGLKLPEDPAPIAWTLLIGGVLIWAAEWWLRHHQGKDDPSWAVALVIGASQLLGRVLGGWQGREGVSTALVTAMRNPGLALVFAGQHGANLPGLKLWILAYVLVTVLAGIPLALQSRQLRQPSSP
jgi:undecaprenyl-diphosphatase